MKCDNCGNTGTVSAVIQNIYHVSICRPCIAEMSTVLFSSGAQSFDRRRQYEDNAQDTVQPYNAAGPNLEFFRLYPDAAKKVFTPAEIEQLKRKL